MSLADLALAAGRRSATDAPDKGVDVITFIEAPWGLGLRLFPVQRVILKAHYGLALDDNPHGFDLAQPIPVDHPEFRLDLVDDDGFYALRIPVTDWRRQNLRYMTEAGYLRYLHDDGRCNVREVVPGKERREMVLSVGRRSGKCVTGDTLVLTDEGVFPIEELGDPHGAKVQPLDVGVAQEGPAKTARSSFFYNGGVKPTYKITTYLGYTIEGTANHRVRVMSPEGHIEWAYLDEVHEGTQVCLHRGTNLWAREFVDVRRFHNDLGRKSVVFPDILTAEWGYLLGVLVGDGSWTLANRVEVTVGDAEYRERVEQVFISLLGEAHFKPDVRTASTGQIGCNSVAWRQFLGDLGWVQGCAFDSKRVPWSILRSPREVVAAFLQGLFDADGGIESSGKVVSFSTASPRLAREVQTLLLNFNVVSRVSIKRNPKYQRDYCVLTVYGRGSRQAFADNVGFSLLRKKEPLVAALAAGGREGRDAEAIPHMRSWVKKCLESVPRRGKGRGWGRSLLREAFGNTCKPGSTDELTANRLSRALATAQDVGADPEIVSHLQGILGAGYAYDPVVQVTQSQAPVYDLTVPDGHMFVANGMTNHNTLITSCIIAYETYKLLLKGNPQAYYGSSQSNVVQLISVATDKDQAGLLYRESSGHFSKCDFFKAYMANATQSFATFQTPFDIERYGSYKDNPKARYSINVTFRSCVAKGLRGGANILVALDEVAHFTDEGQSSADDVYQAVEPSTRTFSPKDPKNTTKPIGENEGRIILISSPLGKQGLFYKQYSLGFTGGVAADNMLCVEAPTWEVNPTVPAGTFEGSYLKDPRVFFTEFGARFTDRTRGWIEDAADLFACVDTTARPKSRGAPRQPHFMGLDVALVGDYTSVAIGHVTPENKIALDYIERIRAGEGDYTHRERLEFDDVADWVERLSKQFYISEGIFDQWAGIPMEQALAKRGLGQMKSVHHTRSLTSQMFQNFKDMMLDKRLVLFDWPIPNGEEHTPYLKELLELQAEVISKYIILVQAPNMEGKHDDYSDALARMVWVATQKAGNPVTITGVHHTRSLSSTSRTLSPAAGFLRLKRSGSHPDRIVPKKKRW